MRAAYQPFNNVVFSIPKDITPDLGGGKVCGLYRGTPLSCGDIRDDSDVANMHNISDIVL